MTERPTTFREKLSRSDVRLIATCVLLAVASIFVVIRYCEAAFPQVSIDFRFDRNTSRVIAERLAQSQSLELRNMKHAVRFDSDSTTRIFLERSLGLEKTRHVTKDQVRLWYWHHRWYRPLVEEEVSVDVAPTGEIVGFHHNLPEEIAAPPLPAALAEAQVLRFLRTVGVPIGDLQLVEQSERRLPRRTQRLFTFESKTIRPADAPLRHRVTLDGAIVTSYTQQLDVPESWLRGYRDLRSKNAAAGSVDLIFQIITMIAVVVVFAVRLRRGDLPIRFLLAIGLTTIVLVGGVALNSIPSQLAWYDTTTSYPAFVAQIALQAGLESIGMAMLLIVVCGAGEVLYRERLPQQLAIPKVWTLRALASRRVFRSMILGYALVPMFIAYQTVFYIVTKRFGAWAPAEVPYDEMLNTAIPWIAVVFAGFFPALSEEFLSRAFSIPFFQRFLRSRVFAIVLAGFIWGFGHATYPNQPFWIRGVEVGIAGIVAGLLMDRFGLIPLLIWHYTIDAVYTATLLFSSGNSYYVASAALASLVFAIPLVASIVLYVRNRGFVPDDDLTNATLPTAPPPPAKDAALAVAKFPAPMPLTRRRVIAAIVLACVAAALVFAKPLSPGDALDYPMTKEQAKQVARAAVCGSPQPMPGQKCYERIIATPVEGFRSWNPFDPREEGGAPAGFDSVAATYLVLNGTSIAKLIDVFHKDIPAGTWTVRLFTPGQTEEVFVEIDPRTTKIIGFHRYLEESKAGASLAREQAFAVAGRAFAVYGVDAKRFALQEALSFQQPSRRDWLFHFQQREPLAGNAFRRVTVRIAGAQVSQFTNTIKAPESVYREAQTQRLLNVILFAMKIAGVVTLLAIAISGLVIASRRGGFRWRRALRWTLLLSLIPILTVFARYEEMLFGYSTSVSWETFRISLVTAILRDVALQAGVMFLALAGIESVAPYALSLAKTEGRARFGRQATIAAITAVSVIAAGIVVMRFVARAVPTAALVELNAPMEVGLPYPALIALGQAIFGAITFAGAVALYRVTLRKRIGIVTVLAVFCAAVDPLVTPAQAPLNIAGAAFVAIVVWLLARYVLGRNPLAWPLAIFIALLLESAVTLLGQSRADLMAHGVGLVVIAIAACIWASSVRPWEGATEGPAMPGQQPVEAPDA